MQHKTKSLSLVLLSVLILSLAAAGCSGQVTSTPAAAPATLEPTAAPLPATETPVPAATTAATWSLETRVYQQTVDTPKISVYIQYPGLLNAAAETTTAFDQAVQQIYEPEATSFVQALVADPPPDEEGLPHISDTNAGYTVWFANTAVVSLTLDFHQYVNAAMHPTHMQRALVFDFQRNRALTLEDLFQPGQDYLTRIADASRQSLTDQGVLSFPEGVDPLPENFDNWVLTADGLTILFDLYQVAPYAAGMQQVTIPYADLADILQPGVMDLVNAPAVSLPVTSVPIQEAPAN